jgi:hypothetical protein
MLSPGPVRLGLRSHICQTNAVMGVAERRQESRTSDETQLTFRVDDHKGANKRDQKTWVGAKSRASLRDCLDDSIGWASYVI